MSKKSSKKNSRTLTQEEKDLGKKRIYIILAMIIAGLVVAMYNMR